MKCNVCSEEKRCYSLMEMTGPVMRPLGLVFNICTECLVKLITPIAVDTTTVDNPDDYPLRGPTHVIDRMLERREASTDRKNPIRIRKE